MPYFVAAENPCLTRRSPWRVAGPTGKDFDKVSEDFPRNPKGHGQFSPLAAKHSAPVCTATGLECFWRLKKIDQWQNGT